MTIVKPASQAAWPESSAADVARRQERIAPAPRISVQAFCETVETAAAIQVAGEDRRMARAQKIGAWPERICVFRWAA